MTINNLLKLVPNEEDRNKIITIYIPLAIEEDEKGKEHPVIEIDVTDKEIVLTPDAGW